MGHVKKRKILHKRVKGFQGGRKNLLKIAKTALMKAGSYAYRDRRVKKRTMRAQWNIQVNAAVREAGTSYSRFMGALKQKNIELNRKVLAELGAEHPAIFAKILEATK